MMVDNDILSVLELIESSTDFNKKQEGNPLSTTPLTGGFLLPDKDYLGTDYLMGKAQSVAQKTSKLPSKTAVSSLPEDELFSIFEDIESMNRTIREAITETPFYDTESRKKGFVDRVSIELSQPENAIIRLSFPPLLRAKRSDAYNTYWAVKNALEVYFKTHERPNINGQKMLLIYKKYTIKPSVDYTCDNDNWDMKRVTNAIAESLYTTDNAANFSFLYTAVRHPKNLVEATLIPYKNLGDFLDYLTSENRG